ncbi:MAG: hypothetical protein ACRDL7_11610, partial [Gaiellaceae bacterium]
MQQSILGVTTPTVGGYKANTPWTGGKRSNGFSMGKPKSPMCYRPEDPFQEAKIYKKATDGMKDKFGGEDKE